MAVPRLWRREPALSHDVPSMRRIDHAEARLVYDGNDCVVLDISRQLPRRGGRGHRGHAAIYAARIHETAGSLRAKGPAAPLATASFHVRRKPLGRGWLAIGYHVYIPYEPAIWEGDTWGHRWVVYQTLPLTSIGAHNKGYNTTEVGVVFQGKLSKYDPSLAQRRCLEDVATWLIGACPNLGGPNGVGRPFRPHNEVSKKSCPGPWLTKWCGRQMAE